MKQINKLKSLLFGDSPVYIANNGKPVDQVTIRYKDLYFFVDIDVESGEPTGSFGWSHDPTMNPTVAIRDIWRPILDKSHHPHQLLKGNLNRIDNK